MIMHNVRSRPRWWSAVLVLLALTLSLIQPALAMAAGVETSTEAINLLRQYNVVRGDASGNLLLNEPITRAQMAVILVRIHGKEAEAQTLTNLNLFSDTKGHWAEGYAAAARLNGLLKGFEDGTFRPEEPVTYGQAFTMILRLVGREPDPATWPTSAMLDALMLKMVPTGFTGNAMLNAPAVRGEIFHSLALALTSQKTAGGITYFQKYIDNEAPQLTVTAAGTIMESSYQIQGTAKGASSVTVNGEAAALAGDTFSKTVSLSPGVNRFTVEASDLAGNKATKEVTISRGSPAVTLSINGVSKVRVGGTASYVVQAADVSGNNVSAAGYTARVIGNIGTFDSATGTFHAGQTPGTGKIEVTLGDVKALVDVEVLGVSAAGTNLTIAPVTSVSYNKSMTVAVQVRNAGGELVADDYGRVVSLAASGQSGLTVTPAVAYTEAGVATFTVKGTQPGAISLSASSQGLSADTYSAQFTTSVAVVLVADPARLATTGSTLGKIHAELRDEAGNPVKNTSNDDIYIDLTLDGPGNLLNSRVRIAQGSSSSAQTLSDGVYGTGSQAGTARISGKISSGQNYSVTTATITTYTPGVGSGTKFVVTPITGNPAMGGTATFVVQLVDANGNAVSGGDYAFQLAVDTSNNDPKTDGVPDGVTVRVGSNPGLNPVSDGKAGGNDIIARTVNGSALIEVDYNKPGIVTIKPVAVGSTDTAYSTEGIVDKATASSSSWILDTSAGSARFTATPNAIKVTVDTGTFGKDQPMGLARAGSAQTMTLHAYVAYAVDVNDPAAPRYWVPNFPTKRLGLYKNGGTQPIATANTSDGAATFTVTSLSGEGEDTYVVKDLATSNALAASNNMYIRTYKYAPAAPGQPFMRGLPSNTYAAVQSDDTTMEIDLPVDPSERYVTVKLYSDNGGSTSLVYTSTSLINVESGSPKLSVPKAKLPAGVYSYRVTYVNAAGESAKGALSDPVTNYTLSTSVQINSAKLDLVNGKVYLYGYGFAGNDAVDPGRIKIHDPNIGGSAGDATLSGAIGQYVNSGLYILDIQGALDYNKLLTFGGSGVTISATAGWYAKANGQLAGDSLSKPVSPAAHIDYAVYDKSNRRVIVYGRGFSVGTLVRSKVTVAGQKLDAQGMSVTRSGDTQLWVTLNDAAVTALNTTGAVQVAADAGWYVSDTGNVQYVGQAAAQQTEIYGNVRLSSVSYSNGTITITGDGFAGGQFGSGVVKVRDNSLDKAFTLTADTIAADGRSVTYTITGQDKIDFETTFRGGDVYLIAEPDWFQVKVATSQYRSTYGIVQGMLKFMK